MWRGAQKPLRIESAEAPRGQLLAEAVQGRSDLPWIDFDSCRSACGHFILYVIQPASLDPRPTTRLPPHRICFA